MILLLLLLISSTLRSSDAQKPEPKNTLYACEVFFIIFFFVVFWLGQNMENDVNSSEMLCNKISENPRKGILQSLDRGMNKNQKTNIFSNSTYALSLVIGRLSSQYI